MTRNFLSRIIDVDCGLRTSCELFLGFTRVKYRNNRTVIWKFATVYGVFNGRKSINGDGVSRNH